MADELTGFGSTFSIGNPVTLIELANIEDFPDLPSFTSNLLDTTNFKTEGGVMTYMNAPLKDGDESNLVMKIALGSPSDAACRLAMADGKARPYKMVLPTPTGTWEITGSCIVRSYKRTNPKADLRMATLGLKWSGIATEAAGATGGGA